MLFGLLLMKNYEEPPDISVSEELLGELYSVKVSGKLLYDFHKNSGLLKVAMPPKDLKRWMKKFGSIPKTGKDLEMPVPIFKGELSGHHVVFRGVRKIESMGKDYFIFIPRNPPGWDLMEGLIRKIFR